MYQLHKTRKDFIFPALRYNLCMLYYKARAVTRFLTYLRSSLFTAQWKLWHINNLRRIARLLFIAYNQADPPTPGKLTEKSCQVKNIIVYQQIHQGVTSVNCALLYIAFICSDRCFQYKPCFITTVCAATHCMSQIILNYYSSFHI